MDKPAPIFFPLVNTGRGSLRKSLSREDKVSSKKRRSSCHAGFGTFHSESTSFKQRPMRAKEQLVNTISKSTVGRRLSSAEKSLSLVSAPLRNYPNRFNYENLEQEPSSSSSSSTSSAFFSLTSISSQLEFDKNKFDMAGKKSLYSIGLFCAAISSLLTCSFPAGYNLGVINTPQTILKNFCNETLTNQNKLLTNDQLDLLWSVVVSIFLVGSILGSLVSAWISDRLGRKRATLLTALIGFLSAVCFAFSNSTSSVPLLIIGRILAGIHCGICSSLTPMYLMEIAPKALQGSLGITHCLGMTMGMFVGQVLGQGHLLGTPTEWPILLALHGLVILVGILPLLLSPESPTFLYLIKGKEQAAWKVLVNLMNGCPGEIEEQMEKLRIDRKILVSGIRWSMWSVLTSPKLRGPLFLVCALHIGQQMSGINAVFYYSTMTFEKVGMTTNESQLASIGCAGLNFIFALIAMPLVTKYSRRTLLLISSSLSCVMLVILTISISFQTPEMGYVTIGAIMLYVCFYGIGLGPIPYMIGADLFESGPRPVGMSLGCLANWASNFLVAISFPMLTNVINEYVFLVFAICCIVVSVIVNTMLPPSRSNEATTQLRSSISEVQDEPFTSSSDVL
ncbi:Solute carrier family 2, facilitated glucose transporter member 3 [Halotydeus destructor]|nr:Solute carrier family 2, facilitated glucose transporter member 3 [Halotydeus destructor]